MPLQTKVNFNKIWEASHRNREFFESYLTDFDDLVGVRLSNLMKACEENDRIALKKLIHKMRPQIDFFDLKKIAALMLELERTCVDSENTAIKSKITEISQKLAIAHIAVKSKLLELKNESHQVTYGD